MVDHPSGHPSYIGTLCRIIAVIACQVARNFLRLTCWSGGKIPWFAILMFFVRPYVRRDGNDPFILTLGWCCPITCILIRRYRPSKEISPIAGNRSRFASCERFPIANGDVQLELQKANEAFDFPLPFGRDASKSAADGFVAALFL
jgi:hypothetical protein